MIKLDAPTHESDSQFLPLTVAIVNEDSHGGYPILYSSFPGSEPVTYG